MFYWHIGEAEPGPIIIELRAERSAICRVRHPAQSLGFRLHPQRVNWFRGNLFSMRQSSEMRPIGPNAKSTTVEPGRAYLQSGRELEGKGTQVIPIGNRLILKTSGGGGLGDPSERDAGRVADDAKRDLT